MRSRSDAISVIPGKDRLIQRCTTLFLILRYRCYIEYSSSISNSLEINRVNIRMFDLTISLVEYSSTDTVI